MPNSQMVSNPPSEQDLPANPEELRRQRITIISIVIGVIIIIALLVISIVFLMVPSTEASTVSRIRDVFIIIMALESLLIGLVLIILIVQIARLTNLLQNEVKPILESTNETISNLRGTAAFLSNNLVEPVMKLNEYLAAIQKFTEIIRIGRRKK
jgi:membrane protein implicated in regulation of membrane protease activity